jgi:predicted oxidoreductase
VDAERMREEIEAHDRRIDEGPLQSDDEQLLWIAKFREYPGDRLRTCDFQKILDPKARPLIAIREFILSRKSLGGIQTDLHCRVLAHSGEPIPGLYAVGEAAGFGGGGIHGVGSLEGTFLGSCVLTAQAAARAIAEA